MLVVCGEALVDLISDGSPSGYLARPGGSPLNVAVGAARLGVPTALLTRFGSGHFGSVLREHASESEVDLSLSINAREPATLAVVSLTDAGTAEYDFYIDGTADSGWRTTELPDGLPHDTQILHVGSIAAWRAPATQAITELVIRERERGAALISFDPNLRPALVQDAQGTRARVEQLVTLATVVKVSAEDVGWLYPDQQTHLAAMRWSQAGPDLVVLTDGPRDVRAYRRGQLAASVPVPTISVVDSVGAGDAFTAGLLAELTERNLLTPKALGPTETATLAEILHSAAVVAALTCARSGADPPTRAERDRALHGRSAEQGAPSAPPGTTRRSPDSA